MEPEFLLTIFPDYTIMFSRYSITMHEQAANTALHCLAAVSHIIIKSRMEGLTCIG